MAHTAATYASVLALLVVGGKAAYESIDRKRLYQFFMSIKDKESGGFLVHDGGYMSGGWLVSPSLSPPHLPPLAPTERPTLEPPTQLLPLQIWSTF